MAPATLTILDGSTFCICDERGDLLTETQGFFASDTRFLSRLCLRVNGERPLLLSSAKVEYFSASFYLRNPPAGGLEHDVLSIARNRFVGEGMEDRLLVQNLSMNPVEFDLSLEVGCDFADIFAVKGYDFALGDPLRAPPLPPRVPARYDDEHGQFLLADAEFDGVQTQIVLSRPGDVDGDKVTYRVALDPHERWELWIEIVPSLDGAVSVPRAVARRFGDERARVRDSLTAWNLSVPRLVADWDDLEHAFRRSVSSLASLRMRGGLGEGKLPAAGMPWFMTVFGRDTIVTCLQTLLFGPDLARSALHALADLQATELDPEIDAEPGKIVHEVRNGKAATNVYARSYSTVDSTVLYLLLLSEVWRWTDDAAALAARFDEAFWTDARGGYYVLALDGDKRQVDSLCSNIGHLLWSGVVPAERVDSVVDRLMGESLWSGWGVRTMSSADAGYNPLSYHNGSVWPHDNSLIAWGLACHGRWQEAQRIVRRMLGASGFFDYDLPEVFAGLPRSETPFPIAYPTAARPQAWAAGAPVLLLQVLLGLRPDRRRQVLATEDGLELPSWAGSLRLSDVRCFDRLWDVRVERGAVTIEQAR